MNKKMSNFAVLSEIKAPICGVRIVYARMRVGEIVRCNNVILWKKYISLQRKHPLFMRRSMAMPLSRRHSPRQDPDAVISG